MWRLYVFSVLAGLFAANGVPHFIKGGMGQKHQTPFGKNSSAVVNLCWGWINLVVAAIFLYFGHVRTHEYRAFALFAVAALIMSIFNASVWSRQRQNNK
jgi:hypothetical protein